MSVWNSRQEKFQSWHRGCHLESQFCLRIENRTHLSGYLLPPSSFDVAERFEPTITTPNARWNLDPSRENRRERTIPLPKDLSTLARCTRMFALAVATTGGLMKPSSDGVEELVDDQESKRVTRVTQQRLSRTKSNRGCERVTSSFKNLKLGITKINLFS